MPYALLLLTALKSFFTDEEYGKLLLKILQIEIPLWAVILIVLIVTWSVIGIANLRKRISEKKSEEVIYYKSPYVTFKQMGTSQRYCANCWQNDHKKVQLHADFIDCFECPICHSTGNFSELDEKPHPSPFDNIYKF